jgi:hypothetical protein
MLITRVGPTPTVMIIPKGGTAKPRSRRRIFIDFVPFNKWDNVYDVRDYAPVFTLVLFLISKLFSAKYLLRNVLAKDNTTGPRIKANSPLTMKPGTKSAANQKQIPLTTREKAPRLNRLSGNDKVDKTGFTEPLIKPIATPAIIAAGKLAKLTPGTRISTINKLNAVAKTVKK